MRIWRWNVTIERAHRAPKPAPPLDEDLSFLLDYGRGAVVKNMRTGENIGIEIWGIPGQISRGLGSTPATATLPGDTFLLVAEMPFGGDGPKVPVA